MEVKGALLNSRQSGASFSACAAAYIILSFIIGSIAIGAGLQGTDGYLYLSYLVAPLAIALGTSVCAYFTKFSVKGVIKSAANVKCGWKYYALAVALIFGLSFALSRVNYYLTQYVFVPLGYVPRTSYLPSLDGGWVVLAILVIAVIPAIFEEFLFRGVILEGLENSAGGVRALFIAGFCFSLFHGSPEQTIYQFICGCAFSLLAIRAKSILPCVLAHFLNNTYIILCYAYAPLDGAGNVAMPQWADILLIVLGAVALAASVAALIFDKRQMKKCEKGGVAGFFIFASVGIALLALLWIFSLVGIQ